MAYPTTADMFDNFPATAKEAIGAAIAAENALFQAGSGIDYLEAHLIAATNYFRSNYPNGAENLNISLRKTNLSSEVQRQTYTVSVDRVILNGAALAPVAIVPEA